MILKKAHFFSGRFKRRKSISKELQFGPDTSAIPAQVINPWRGDICAAYTGPNTGLMNLDRNAVKMPPEAEDLVVAGCSNWNAPREFAYGISLSLYEEDRRGSHTAAGGQVPLVRTPYSIMGDPIADVFGIIARENCCVMVMADGVNWGKNSRLAARCATRAVMDHVSGNLESLQSSPTTTTVAQLLEESVTLKAQQMILQHHATLTTLSAAIVCELGTPGEWGLFVCAVGDSPVYIYCPHTHQVVEATVGCHDGTRDMKMAGGVLGPSFGSSPDLSNLSYSFLRVYPGDIVFAVSDGVSDNFSNKVMSGLNSGKIMGETGGGKSTLKACCENLPHLTSVLNHHQDDLGANISAQTLSACLINHSVEATQGKRMLRAQCLEENIDPRGEAARNPEFAAKLNAATGKLDHASVVAYQVGRHYPY